MLTTLEKQKVKKQIENFILSTGTKAKVYRATVNENLYGKEQSIFIKKETINIDLTITPPETDIGKIDAIADILPTASVKPEDKISINGLSFRVQTIAPVIFFGLLTHKHLKLVKLYDD